MSVRLTDRNRATGTLLEQALSNINSGEKMTMENASRIFIAPDKTRMNDLHNRMDFSMEGPAITELMESIKASGQQQPAQGWRIQRPGPDGVEIVLIAGARRRAVTKALGMDLLVEIVTEPTDLELIVKMYAENKGRRDYYPLEQAYEFQRYLDSKMFASQTEMATKLGEEPTKVSRTMSLLELPAEVRAAFKDPSTLPLLKGTQLAKQLNESRHARERAIKAATEWVEMGGQGNPFPLIAQAASGKAPKAAPAAPKKLLSEGKEVGRVQGGEKPNQEVRIVLGRDCPEEARDAVLAVFDEHFPEWRKTRQRG